MSRAYGDDFLPLFGRANENAWMSIATLFAWINILWFLLGFQSTGPFVIMMQKMVVSDMRTFCVISAVFVGAFAQSFTLLRDVDAAGRLGNTTTSSSSDGMDGSSSSSSSSSSMESDDPYRSYSHDGVWWRVEELLCAMLGNFELTDYRSTSTHPSLVTFFVLIYVILLSVVLVNMLIAKMGDTYSKISQEAELRWRLEMARMVLSLEKTMNENERSLEGNK